ncbi:DNA polymerase III subunit beta [Desulfobacula phenolica]|uniref:Beta sliding clamp n=1 Tax=Desulfobacula phenolica TaxID=90732 RepID=A0A1H2K062_9BACT|nr:DNA polymerase III subunit beta [Desulfobacula phenolica]SDU61943.1 DNA polymerase-3 subunit beta [Desulfobacula phenolica]
MKFSFDKKEIVDVLSKIQGLTGRKTNLTITSDILIKAMESGITITANDLETVFLGTYKAEVEKEGILSINSKKFFEIIKEYPENKIFVNEIENRWVEIGEGDSIYHIVSSDYKNFPETPVIENIEFIEIDSKNLKKMVDVSGIVNYSGDEKRIYVMGSLIEKISTDSDEKLRIVSTDSKRLHCCDTTFKGNLHLPDESVIVPKKGLSELNKFIDTGKDDIKVGIKDNYFIFQNKNESIMIKLLEGEFPEYKPVLNYEDMTPIEMDRRMFSTLMKRVSILTSDDYKSVILNFKNNELVVTITNPEIGESKERMMVSYSNEEIKSAFNPKYFIDALSIFEDSIIVVNIKDNKSPCIIKSIDDDKLICVIMAMHIS